MSFFWKGQGHTPTCFSKIRHGGFDRRCRGCDSCEVDPLERGCGSDRGGCCWRETTGDRALHKTFPAPRNEARPAGRPASSAIGAEKRRPGGVHTRQGHAGSPKRFARNDWGAVSLARPARHSAPLSRVSTRSRALRTMGRPCAKQRTSKESAERRWAESLASFGSRRILAGQEREAVEVNQGIAHDKDAPRIPVGHLSRRIARQGDPLQSHHRGISRQGKIHGAAKFRDCIRVGEHGHQAGLFGMSRNPGRGCRW